MVILMANKSKQFLEEYEGLCRKYGLEISSCAIDYVSSEMFLTTLDKDEKISEIVGLEDIVEIPLYEG